MLREQPKDEVAIHIAGLLKRLAKLYQVPNWDSDSEILLTEWILEMYPTESIETVIKCLTNPPIAVKTEGKTWRLTPDVINSWMEREIERETIKREKQIHNDKKEEENWSEEGIAKFKELVEKAPAYSRGPAMSQQEIEEEGQEQPKKPKYVSTTKEHLVRAEMHRRWAVANHDLETGKRLSTWISEDEWLRMNQ